MSFQKKKQIELKEHVGTAERRCGYNRKKTLIDPKGEPKGESREVRASKQREYSQKKSQKETWIEPGADAAKRRRV